MLIGYSVTDDDGRNIDVGTKIKDPFEKWHPGVVESVSDPDGDVDDYGRTIAINPKVTVRWRYGDRDECITYWPGTHYWDDTPFICEEIEVLKWQKIHFLNFFMSTGVEKNMSTSLSLSRLIIGMLVLILIIIGILMVWS